MGSPRALGHAPATEPEQAGVPAEPRTVGQAHSQRRGLDAVLTVRRAVRRYLSAPELARHLRSGQLYVAVSGGADSLALTEAAVHVGHRRDLRVGALVVDHGLQPGSAEVAATAADTALELGADTATVLEASVSGAGGPEAAARRARYAALRYALADAEGTADGDSLVLLGHTRDDQAETVLLGLGRGSGPRSVAGMRPLDPPWGRPLLDLPRSLTRAACAELGIGPWQDPHNTDPRYTRVRLREEVLPLLEDVLSGGVAAALARTATQLREDCEALDALAADLAERAGDGEHLLVRVLEPAPAPVRRRVLRRWLLDAGVPELTDAHLRSVDAFVGAWRGQGGTYLPGDFVVRRVREKLVLNLCQSTTRGD